MVYDLCFDPNGSFRAQVLSLSLPMADDNALEAAWDGVVDRQYSILVQDIKSTITCDTNGEQGPIAEELVAEMKWALSKDGFCDHVQRTAALLAWLEQQTRLSMNGVNLRKS